MEVYGERRKIGKCPNLILTANTNPNPNPNVLLLLTLTNEEQMPANVVFGAADVREGKCSVTAKPAECCTAQKAAALHLLRRANRPPRPTCSTPEQCHTALA